jgi:hypothetical protein
LAGLVLVRCRVESLEEVLRPVDSGHCAVSFRLQLVDGARHGPGEHAEPVPFLQQPLMVRAKGLHRVQLAVEDPGDAGEAQAELAQQQDLLEPQQLGLLVVAVTIGADMRRWQQADVVVMPQGAGADSRHPGHLRDRPGHGAASSSDHRLLACSGPPSVARWR